MKVLSESHVAKEVRKLFKLAELRRYSEYICVVILIQSERGRQWPVCACACMQ